MVGSRWEIHRKEILEQGWEEVSGVTRVSFSPPEGKDWRVHLLDPLR